MKKIAAATVALTAAFALTACGTASIDTGVRQIDTPDGKVTCVVLASQGGSAVAVDCNWVGLP